MIATGPNLDMRVTVDVEIRLSFDPSHTQVNPLKAVLKDPKRRADAVLAPGSDVGFFEKESGKLVLPASLRLDLMQSSMVLSTEEVNELGRGARMDRKGNIRLVGRGSFGDDVRWKNTMCMLLVAGTVSPTP
jgi:hypothetical protein